ncbi:SDR family oxidoreductase [Symmachiella dynata]|uniref:SDR family oxidoreductase n=1 Tax=Symmachiella dynata TaxID=2527995 RepID=UPI0030EBB2A6
MSYQLLTGATGLLGRYLIRDLMQADVPLAVLVRPTRKASVRQRVEQMMAFWEERLGHAMPRPVVLEGDISQENLGLDDRSVKWVEEHCTGMIHNAASLTFHSTGPESEPWRSNIQGVRHVLDLCEKTGIRQFLHMSTAYVCGLREGRVLETELDVGQERGNDYEMSKIDAEKMVHAASFIDDLTICRPAIIVGDSQTGYTSTYHGFYAALQLAYTLVRSMEPDDTGRVRSIARFELSGNESKNLVPVDWVSAATTHIVTHPELHGQTYHLTPRHPATIRLVSDILEDATRFYSAKFVGEDAEIDDWGEAEQIFNDNIHVYNSYWRDDPTFDCTNTLTAMPHLPCPDVDREMLLRMSKVAIDSNFGGGRDKRVDLDFDPHQHLKPLVDAGEKQTNGQTDAHLLGLEVTGGGGGAWHLMLQDGKLVGADIGRDQKCTAVYRLDADTFATLATGQESASSALDKGQLVIDGNGLSRSELVDIFDEIVRGSGVGK